MCPTGEIGIFFDRSCWQLIYCTWLFCDISPEENIDLSLTLLNPNSIRSSMFPFLRINDTLFLF